MGVSHEGVAAGTADEKVTVLVAPQGKAAYSTDLPAENGSKQRVFVAAALESYETVETRKIWSLATVLKEGITPEFLTTLLEQNARTKLGAWVIEKNGAGEYLIIFCAKVDAGTSPESLRNSVEFVSKVASTMKQQIVSGKFPVNQVKIAGNN